MDRLIQEIPSFFSIFLSISTNSKFNFFDNREPMVDFPEPIIPIKTKLLYDPISFYIEKTQICLNLKLLKTICNL